MAESKNVWKVKRRYPRLKYAVRVRYSSPNISVFEETADIGPGGAFINSKLLDAVGTEADLRFFLPGKPSPVTCRGVVRWTPLDEEIIHGRIPERIGMGIEFIEGGEEIGKALESVMRSSEDADAFVTFTPPVVRD